MLLKFVVYAHAELSNRVSVIARGTQSQLYNLGYPWKDMEEGDLFHAPSPLPEAAGHYRLGMSDDRCKEADLAYKSFAHDQANKTAYAKGGANRPGRYTGNKKKYAISKSSYLDFGYDLVEDEKFGEDGRRASAVKKTAWLLERGRHYLGPSWCTPYGKNQVDEEQVTCLELVNNVPLRAQDVSLVRKAMLGTYDVASHLSGSRIAYRIPVLLQMNEADDLSLQEMRRWKQENILPRRINLARTYPHRKRGASGHAVIIDFHDQWHRVSEESSFDVGSYLGSLHFNVLPHIYDAGGDSGRDPLGYVSVGMGYCIQAEFGLKPFSAFSMAHATSGLDFEWQRWCRRTVEANDAPPPATSSERLRRVLHALDGYGEYAFDPNAFHGVLTFAEFQDGIERWRPRVGDEAAIRRTHVAIIEFTPRPPPPEPTPPDAAEDDVPAVAPDLPLPQIPDGEAYVTQFTRLDDLTVEAELNRVARADEREEAKDAPPPPPSALDPAAVASKKHHIAVAFRYGEHEITQAHVRRESLTPYGGRRVVPRAVGAWGRVLSDRVSPDDDDQGEEEGEEDDEGDAGNEDDEYE